jgi:hypothetical protein
LYDVKKPLGSGVSVSAAPVPSARKPWKNFRRASSWNVPECSF